MVLVIGDFDIKKVLQAKWQKGYQKTLSAESSILFSNGFEF
jgi:hypothetical protein